MNGQTCLICDIEFSATIEVAKHIKKEHLDIIVILELRSEAVKPVVKTEIKQEIQGNSLMGNDKKTVRTFKFVYKCSLFSNTEFIGEQMVRDCSFYKYNFFSKTYFLNGNHIWQTFFGFFFQAEGKLKLLQVNLCQKHLFSHQLTHNMTKDCSLIYQFNT